MAKGKNCNTIGKRKRLQRGNNIVWTFHKNYTFEAAAIPFLILESYGLRGGQMVEGQEIFPKIYLMSSDEGI